MYFVVFKAKFGGVYDGKLGFYSTQTYLTLLRLWIDISFDTQTFGSVYLSNVNNRFSIKTGYRYPALTAMQSDLGLRSLEQRQVDARVIMLYKIIHGVVAISLPVYFEHVIF